MTSPPPPASLHPFVGSAGRLIQMPKPEGRRIAPLHWIAAGLPRGVEVSETDMNAVLHEVNDDVAMLRRHLVDYGFIDRPEPGRYRLPDEPRSVGSDA